MYIYCLQKQYMHAHMCNISDVHYTKTNPKKKPKGLVVLGYLGQKSPIKKWEKNPKIFFYHLHDAEREFQPIHIKGNIYKKRITKTNLKKKISPA